MYPYSRNQILCTFETMYCMYPVPQARNHVPCTLETMQFHQKFDEKWNNPPMFNN